MQCYGAFLGLSEDVIKFLDNNSLLMKIVQILGILDWLATIYVVVLYIIVIFSFGL